MRRAYILICFHLGVWGILGFFATLILGFLVCCADFSQSVFYGLLILFAILGLTISSVCIVKGCNKTG